jgi:hypothetical protein
MKWRINLIQKLFVNDADGFPQGRELGEKENINLQTPSCKQFP